MVRRLLTSLVLVVLFSSPGLAQRGAPTAAQTGTPQNFVIIFTDDQGYGDLGSYGHPTIRTPNLDRMAAEGQRWTSFYAAPVCTPSRAQLMTARYAIRSGLAAGVLFPDSTGGLQPSELTIAEVLKSRGYATLAVGKWHLGHLPQYLPTNQGFDRYFGIPYSNDMERDPAIPATDVFRRTMDPKTSEYNVPLMRDGKVVERPADQTTITRRYTDEAIAFIRSQRTQPFFLYLAHNLPHVPLFRSKEFEGHSARGIYGDVVEEIDHNVGRILDTLRELKIDRQTLVVFLSDNGPWMPYLEQGGSAGILRGAKGSTWEGGMRVPAIFWQPGVIRPAVVTGIGSEMDLLPTFARLANASLANSRPLDGQDLSATLTKGAPSPRETVFYYNGARLTGVRHRAFKLHLAVPAGSGAGGAAPIPAPVNPGWELYNLDEDPSEKFNLADTRRDLVKELTAMMDEHQKTVEPFENQIPLGRGRGTGAGQGRAGGSGRGGTQ
jgi:arylsulfatase A-like enzyme